MKVCSECRKCYDDSIVNCDFEDHGVLTEARKGDCTLVEGYEINAQIESDSPVELYRATHLASKKSVVIRIIRVDSSNAELRNQLQSYSNINHPSLARIFEFGGIGQDEVYIVSEDLEGRTLRNYLNEFSKFKELQAIKIARQIADGLVKIHNAGLLHRNINPANIYLTETETNNFVAKLNYPDFVGIIQNEVVQDANGINARTTVFEYYSPEQFSGNELDFKSDLYSLAILFYELLLGRIPYELLSPQSIKDFVFNEDDVYVLHHDLRALIAYFLRESLHQRLDIRPHSTDKMVRQLRHLELVATPSEFVVKEKVEEPLEPKWMGNYVDREKVIEDLKRSPSMLKAESDESIPVNNPKYEKVILSESGHEFEERYDLEQNEFIDDLESNNDYLPINPVVTDTPSSSYTFKKSHVYVAGVLATILFGSFFLITFYSWQDSADSADAKLPIQPTKQKVSDKPLERENSEIADSQANEVFEEENDTSFDATSRENTERENSETVNASSSVDLSKSNNSTNTKQAKPVKENINKKLPNVEKSPEKKLFEDTIITVGNNQKNTKDQGKKDKNIGEQKNRKVFSDVVITY